VYLRVLAEQMKIFRWTMRCLIVHHASSHSHTSRVENVSLQLSVCFAVLLYCAFVKCLHIYIFTMGYFGGEALDRVHVP